MEHGLKSHEIEQLKINENYINVSNYCRTSHKSGGALILAKEELKIKVENRFDKCSREMDMEITSCLVQGSNLKLCIIVIYRSPKGNLITFFEKLSELLSLVDPDVKTVIVGDFNIDLLVEDSNSDSLVNIMMENNLGQTVFTPTRVTESSSSLIDNLFTNLESDDCKIDVVDSALSDHYGIDLQVLIEIGCVKETRQGFFTRKYTNDIYAVKANLTDLWINGPKEDANLFVHRIANQHNLYFPLKFKKLFHKLNDTVSFRDRTAHYSFVKETTKKMHELRKTNENFQLDAYLLLKGKLRERQRIFKETILKAKADKVKNTIQNAANISKTTWSIVNSNRSCKRKPCEIKEILYEGKVTTDTTKIANVLNEHFIAILNRNSDKSINIGNFDYLESCDNEFYINPITTAEVEQSIDRLKNKKSESHEGLSNHFLKLIKKEISPLLTYHINQSIMSCEFPDSLKNIKVVPLWKGGDSSSPNNYRPLSIVSPISKIYESMVVKQINKFLKINKILCDNQFGFREKLNTEAAVLRCYETVCIKKNNPLVVITIDLSKAFDSVNHKILLYKLKKMGFGKEACKWIKSFMARRKQYVQIQKGDKKYSSESQIIFGGIAQGSLIGPLLFLLFINDLAKFLKVKVQSLLKCFFDFLLFADDILFILSSNVVDDLEIDAYIILNFFLEWCQINLLNINVEKSKYLLFNTKVKLSVSFRILLDEEQMERVAAVKYLGLLMDDDFKFDEHVDIMCKKLHSAIFVLRVLARFCDLDVLIIVYHSLFLSHVQYCINVWSNCKGKKLEKVFLTQKRAIRTILKLKPEESCREHFKKLQLLTVPALIIYSSLKLYNMRKLTEPRGIHNYNTRNQRDSVVMKKSTLMIRAHKFYGKIPLPFRKKIAENPMCHDKVIKSYLIERCPYSIGEFLDGGISN